MDRNAITRVLLIAAVMLGLYFMFFRKSAGTDVRPLPAEVYVDAPDFEPDVLDGKSPKPPTEGTPCTVRGDGYEAELSARGAAVKHFRLLEPRFANSDAKDLSTTPDHERWRSLRMLFRGAEGDDQFRFDRFNWQAKQVDAKTCEFTYADEGLVDVKKVYRAGVRAYELDVETTIVNRASEPKRHRLSVGLFAFRTSKELSGSLGRVSPFLTETACGSSSKVTRKKPEDFKEGWFSAGKVDHFVAISNYYFAQALFPEPGQPVDCSLVTEPIRLRDQKPEDEPEGKSYRAWAKYDARELSPGQAATYKQTAFFGSKQRSVLTHVAGDNRGAMDLIDLGTFTVVAKVLVSFLNFLHDKVTFGNWGIAIIVMTLCVRILLFPLTWKSIQSTVAMRRLKPDLDALNEKFKDDAQARGLAQMELWRKNKINPLGGCLPQLVQMPVWFAMYTTLQTAAEMYQTKFLWFSDMSAPDRFYVLPLVLGALMIVQQRIVPMQGVDPVQAKMMMWLLPAIFTVMMLFLPAALGVYMLTNSALGIIQQLAIERFAPRTPVIGVKEVSASDRPALGKGKARV